MNHPHPDKRHVMVTYRRYILGLRRLHMQDPRNPKPRSLVHYHDLIATYRECKRLVILAAVKEAA